MALLMPALALANAPTVATQANNVEPEHTASKTPSPVGNAASGTNRTPFARLHRYANAVAKRIATAARSGESNANLPPLAIDVSIVDHHDANASTRLHEGGRVSVALSRGLIAFLNSEAELAAVIALETCFATGETIFPLMAKTERAKPDGAGAQIGRDIERGVTGSIRELGRTIERIAANNWFPLVDDESRLLHALQSSAATLHNAGYPPLSLVHALRNQYRVANTSAVAMVEPLGSVSAYPKSRILALHSETVLTRRLLEGIEPNPAIALRQNREGFLQVIDGLPMGPSAPLGVIRGTTFAHPLLGFTFTVPSGWSLVHQDARVIIVSPDDLTTIQLELFELDTLRPFASQFASLDDPRVLERWVRNRTGIPAFAQRWSDHGDHSRVTITRPVDGPGGPTQAIITTYIGKGAIFVWTAAGNGNAGPTVAHDKLAGILASKHSLSDEQRRSWAKPRYSLNLHRVREKSYAGIVTGLGYKRAAWLSLALLNGASNETRPLPESLIKIIR